MSPEENTATYSDLVVYIGVVPCDKGVLGFKYCFVPERWLAGTLPVWRVLAKRLADTPRVGDQLRLTWQDADRKELKAVDRAGRFKDAQKILDWATASEATERSHRAAQQLKKLDKVDVLAEAVEPLRLAYENAPPSTRPQLLARIVYLLTK